MLSGISVSPIVRINLHSGFCGVYFHCASAYRFGYLGCVAQFAFFFLVEYEAMVVSGSVLDLLVIGINVTSHFFRCTEVKRCVLDKADFSCWDRRIVNRKVIVGIDFANEIVNSRCRVCDSGKTENP